MKERISHVPIAPIPAPLVDENPLAPANGDDMTLVMRQSAEVNIDLLVRKLELARKLAMANDEPAAAISAINAMAKLHGLLVDKREMSLKRPEDMSEAELRQVLGIEFDEDLAAGNGLAIEHEYADEN